MLPTHPADPTRPPVSRAALLTTGLICASVWALSHAYLGIFHDAGLYTLQALSHLQPTAYREEVFLHYGSQDRFTLWSPIYARWSAWLGVETAAAALTLLSQLALLAGAYALARAVLPRPLALFGIAVLIAIPGNYGADRIFTCIEAFITPRMAAEALTLASLAAALAGHRLGSLLLLLGAALLHPVMAAAGIAVLLCLEVALPRPRLAAALVAAGLIGIALGPWRRFDPAWLSLLENRSPYLFMAGWDLEDWSRTAVTLATLGLAAIALENSRARALAWSVLLAVLGGFALTAIACDLLQRVLFTQLQPWRCEWVGTVVAALLLPALLSRLWARQTPGRTAALLLTAAWLFAANAYALVAAAGALAAVTAMHRLKPGEARWILWGAGALLAMAALWRFASNLEFMEAHYVELSKPLWIRRSMSFARDGALPVALVALVWWLDRHHAGRVAVPVTGVLAFAVCCALAPQTWRAWTLRGYTPSDQSRFAEFRARIPAGAQVFWPEAPLAVWLLLERPSWLSVLQTSGMVFSRDTALELERRAQQLKPAIAPEAFMAWNPLGMALQLSVGQLTAACATGGFQFLVTPADLGKPPLAAIPSDGTTARQIRLYRCGAVS
jgi:hypothetical protein